MPLREPAPPSGAGRANGVFAALAVAQAASFLWLVAATAIRTPYADLYALIDRAFAVRDGRLGLLAYLWTPHAGHHLPFHRALVLWDMEAFSGSGWPLIVTGLLAVMLAAAVIAREAWVAAPLRASRAQAAAVAVMAALTAAAAFDVSQPVFTAYPFALGFAALALALFASTSVPLRLFGLVAAVCAALGNGVGLAAWPALLWLAWRGERRAVWTAAVAVTGLAFGGVYLHDMAALASPAAGGSLVQRAGFVFAYLGLPLSQVSPPLGVVLGLVLSLAAAALTILFGLRDDRAARLGVALIVFTLFTALAAAAGRVEPAMGVRPPVRYAPLVTPLHAGLLLLALPFAARLTLRQAQGALLACAAALLGGQLALARNDLVTARVIRETLARYRAGERTPEMTAMVYPDLAEAAALDRRLRREGLYQP